MSATATYPFNMSRSPRRRRSAETCGSANTLDQHGLPGAHGLIAYPGAQAPPTSVQATDGAKCFAWGRDLRQVRDHPASMGTTAPYWQNTRVFNGGPCNDPSASCYTIAAQGSPRYETPSEIHRADQRAPAGPVADPPVVHPGHREEPAVHPQRHPVELHSSNPDLHWTNDVERYCYNDCQQIVHAIAARGNITVTDPLTVGVAFGRPATYP